MSKVDELTAFELNMAEKACNTPYEMLTVKEAPKSGLWAALAWVYRKREEPTLTYEAYTKSVTQSDVMEYLFPDDEEDESGEVDEDGFPDPDDGPVLDGDQGEPGGGAGDGEGAVLPVDGGPSE